MANKAALTLTRLLTENYDFEDCEHGTFAQVVDEQHSLVIVDEYWDTRRVGRMSGMAWLSFRIARRDINDLWREVLDPTIPSFGGAIRFDDALFIDDPLIPQLRIDDADQGWVDFFDEWLPQLRGFANLRSIHAAVEALYADGSRLAFVPRMINTMLDGKWDDAAHEEFLAPDIEALERLPPEHDHAVACKRRVPLIQAWLEEHPNGIERQIID